MKIIYGMCKLCNDAKYMLFDEVTDQVASFLCIGGFSWDKGGEEMKRSLELLHLVTMASKP